MSEHLRPLSRCRTCGKPATQELYNPVNAPQGEYCERHAQAALKAFTRDRRAREANRAS